MKLKKLIGDNPNWNVEMYDNITAETKRGKGRGYVYAIECGKYIKIGTTENICQRIQQIVRMVNYYDKVDCGIVVYSKIHTKHCHNEHLLHLIFKEYRIESTEFFKISIRDFVNKVLEIELNLSNKSVKTKDSDFIDVIKSMFVKRQDVDRIVPLFVYEHNTVVRLYNCLIDKIFSNDNEDMERIIDGIDHQLQFYKYITDMFGNWNLYIDTCGEIHSFNQEIEASLCALAKGMDESKIKEWKEEIEK